MSLPDEFRSNRPGGDGFSFVVQSSFQGLDHLRVAWDDAVVRLGGTIYMSYDWCRTWWEFYGEGKELRVFIFRAGEQIVGIVPLYIDPLGFWPVRFKVARLVGANIPPKVFNPPMDESWAEAIWERILVQMFEDDRCDLLSFGPVSELHKGSEALPGVCAGNQKLVELAEVVAVGVHTVFSLPSTMEAYFDGLSKSERKKRQYELRLLRKECEVKTDVLSEPVAVGQEFARFVAQHTSQWSTEGKSGHFGAWPGAREFNEALVKAQAALGRVRFNRIFADGQLVSNQYVFAFGRSYFWELPSREMGPRWDRLSLGPAGAISMIEAAIREGKTRVEGGLGHYEYKIRLGAKEYGVKTVRVLAKRRGTKWRKTLFDAIRFCVLYCYHKIWYRRVIPRLPVFFRRPQWNSWLRLDF
jgi:CelD/BcsL family acetyltransferase involved in cellulose biosynthesis